MCEGESRSKANLSVEELHLMRSECSSCLSDYMLAVVVMSRCHV